MAVMDYSKFSPFTYREGKYLSSSGVDNGEYLMSMLDLGVNDVNIGIMGDSTANASDEWWDLLMVKLGIRYPDRTVQIPHWNDTNQSYDASTLIQTGTTPTPGVVFQDTFTRVAAELYATTPDIGPVWGRDGSNAMGDFTIDGTAAVSSADATSGALVANAPPGNHKITANLTISTLARAGGSSWDAVRINKDYIANYLVARINVSVSGIVSAYIYKRIAGGTLTQVAVLNTPLPTNTASVTFDLIFEHNETDVKLTVNGNLVTAPLAPEEVLVYNDSTLMSISRSPNAGDKFNDFKVELLSSTGAPKLVAYNGSVSGTTLAYQQSRLDAMYPVPLDLAFISAGHNYGNQTPTQFIDALDSYIYDLRVKHPTAGIIITSQNPQKVPASNFVGHLKRQAVVRQYAKARGYGYMALTEKWVKQTNKGVDLINADGVHPIAAGSQLWRDVAYDFLLTKSTTA